MHHIIQCNANTSVHVDLFSFSKVHKFTHNSPETDIDGVDQVWVKELLKVSICAKWPPVWRTGGSNHAVLSALHAKLFNQPDTVHNDYTNIMSWDSLCYHDMHCIIKKWRKLLRLETQTDLPAVLRRGLVRIFKTQILGNVLFNFLACHACTNQSSVKFFSLKQISWLRLILLKEVFLSRFIVEYE